MNPFLNPILEEMRAAIQQFLSAVNQDARPSDRSSPYRRPVFEVFEQRTVLSATGLVPLPVDDLLGPYDEVAVPTLRREVLEQAFTINSITVRINGGADVAVAPHATPLSLRAGDTLEVIGVDYTVSQLGDGLEGVIAAEGYLHKLDDTHGPGAVDYTDGRFGDPLNTDPIVAGNARQGGLAGGWIIEEGWDRLSLVLIRYFGDQSEAAAHFNLQLQVETPDFSMSNKSLKKLERQTFRVGETAYMTVEWGNSGQGRYHNYLEMDVHHVEDMENPVWVGVSVATLGKKESVALVLENDNPNDAFTQYWTPQQAGRHRLLIAVDPEDAWQEKKESNNRVELWVTVEDAVAERGPKTKGQGDGRRVAHAGLAGPVPVDGTNVTGTDAAAAATTDAVAASPVGLPLAPLTAAGRLAPISSPFVSAGVDRAADPWTPGGREFHRFAVRAVTLDATDPAFTSDAEQDRWRWANRDGAGDDELSELDSLLAGDELLDSHAPSNAGRMNSDVALF